MLLHATLVFCAFSTLLVSADELNAEREQANHDEGKLEADLFSAYKRDFRPVKDHKSAVNIKVRFAIKYMKFDSLEETFTLHSWVALSWKDVFLTWTPADYGNIKEIQIDSSKLWAPRMALFNADASYYQSEDFYTTCLLASDGTVTCVPHLTHSGICSTSLRRWPFDQQNCTLFFGSWMHTGEQVNFTFYQNQAVVTDDFQDGPGWKLVHAYHERLSGKYNCCPNSTYPMLKYTFLLKREAAGPAAIIVVPAVVIVLVTLTAMLLDVKDNTRLILLCFGLYGHFMFLTEIGYDIPKHSADTPILLLFLRDSMMVTLAGILETLVLMHLRKQVIQAPPLIVSLCRLINSGPGKYAVFTEFDPSNAEVKELTDESASADINDKTSHAHLDWIQFANILNSLLFIVAVLVYMVLLCIYIPYDD